MEADPALARPAGVVVLDPEAPEDAHASVVHPHRYRERILAQRRAQEVPCARVQAQLLGHTIELPLSHLE